MRSPEHLYTVGGTVQARGGIYIRRRADDELLALCRRGAFAYVLSARQMGKSSLMVQVADDLARTGIDSAIVDLSVVGSYNVDEGTWYLGLLTEVSDSMGLPDDPIAWWTDAPPLAPAQRFLTYLEDVVLRDPDRRVVIFVDEIDTTLILPFSDDFFAAIRNVYNARASNRVLERLSFVLIGVATPDELVKDARRTPFNIGSRVDVQYFSQAEAEPLAAGLPGGDEAARAVMSRIVHWTSGHPYLTQKLCLAAATEGIVRAADVDRIVDALFLQQGSDRDSNIRFVQDMLTRRTPEGMRETVLRTYARVRTTRRPEPDRPLSVIVSHLKLSGLVTADRGRLRVSNRVYERAFDGRWIREQLPEHWVKRIPPSVRVASLVGFLALVVIILLQLRYSYRLSTARDEARAARDSTLVALRGAETAREIALRESALALEATRARDSSLTRALDAQRSTAEALEREEVERLAAERARSEALEASLDAELHREIAERARDSTAQSLQLATNSRLQTVGLAVAHRAVQEAQIGNYERAALLARQAWSFHSRSEGDFVSPVYDALRTALRGLAPETPETGLAPVTYPDAVRSVAFREDALVTGGNDGVLYLWRPNEGQVHPRPIGRHTDIIRVVGLLRGNRLISGADDGFVRVWQVDDDGTVDMVFELRAGFPVRTLAIGPDGRMFAVPYQDGSVRIVDVAGHEMASIPLESDARVSALAFVPQQRTLVLGTDAGLLLTLPLDDAVAKPVLSWQQPSPILDIAVRADGRLLATAGQDGIVRLWNLGQGVVEPYALQGHLGPANAVAFSPDGRLLASASSDHSVRLWDVERKALRPIDLEEHESWVHELAFSPDGRRLASAGADRVVRLWSVNAAELAAAICREVSRDLTPQEWIDHVGPDLSYDMYQPCARPMSNR